MSEVDDSLRQIEALIAALEGSADPQTRQIARGLLQVVLDLHGLALSQVAAIVAASPGGPALLERLAEDPHIRAVLLLHGLHPQEPAERIAAAVAAMNDELGCQGVRISVRAVTAASARLLVLPGAADPANLQQRIEAAIVEAAPELEELVIDGLESAAEGALPALAG